MIGFIISLFLGILIGIITGLSPGIHINLISSFLTSSTLVIARIDPLLTSSFIVSLAITHTIIDFIPSIYLGAPEEDTFLSVLPGHELLQEGRGHEAVVLALYGSIMGIISSIILIIPFIYLAAIVEEKITLIIPFILIFIFIFMILKERKIILSSFIFTLAGFIGYASLNIPVKEPLLPLLGGLFGASALMTSIKNSPKINSQKIPKIKEIRCEKKDFISTIWSSFIIAPIFSFLPALGSGYASLSSSEIFGYSRKGFIMLNGAVNSIIMLLSFALIYSIGKARTGAAAAISNLLEDISLQDLSFLIISAVFAAIFSFLIGIKISKIFANKINKIKYGKLSILVLVFLSAVVLLISGITGILIYITSTALGVFTICSKIKRIHLMGALLVPTLIYYLI